jgi:hypothetical protein
MATRKIWALVVGIFAALILLNVGGGFFFEVPDNIPGIGNLDEASAVLLLIWAYKQIFGKGDGPPPGQKPPEKTVH